MRQEQKQEEKGMIHMEEVKGTQAVVLENERLRVTVLPEIGGKIASIYHKAKEFELLFQNKEEVYRKAGLYDSFAEFDASGFDDAFPTIDEETAVIGNQAVNYPDHGEIWTMAFEYETAGEKLLLRGTSSILPYHYGKTLELQEDRLVLRYDITNFGPEDIPCLWVMHCLLRCEEEMQLIFPQGVEQVRNVTDSRYLGERETLHLFPATTSTDGREYRLDRIFPAAAGKCEKYYVEGKVGEGVCGAYYPQKDVTCRICFDKEKLPYLGFWITEGGFRGDYNCAMEPANGFYDSVETAGREKTLYILKAGATLSFDLQVELK